MSSSMFFDDGVCDKNNNQLLDSDKDENFLRLSLKKPKIWKWELTTAASSANIAFPIIQLVDALTGEVLAEVDEPDVSVRSDTPLLRHSRSKSANGSQSRDRSESRSRRSKSSSAPIDLAPLVDHFKAQGFDNCKITRHSSSSLSRTDSLSMKKEDNIRPPKPIMKRRPMKSLFDEEFTLPKGDKNKDKGIQRSQSLAVCSKAEKKPVRKKRYSTRTNSILEKIREFNHQPSSSDDDEKRNDKYTLVSCNIGSIFVHEDSFRNKKYVRRRKIHDGQNRRHKKEIEKIESVNENEENLLIQSRRYSDEINKIDELITKVMLSEKQRENVGENEPKRRRSLSMDRFGERIMTNFDHKSAKSECDEGRKSDLIIGIKGGERGRQRRRSCSSLLGENGDQTVAIKNLSVTNIESKSHLINNSTATDQVLLKLVQRLASLQHHSTKKHNKKHSINNNTNSKNKNVHQKAHPFLAASPKSSPLKSIYDTSLKYEPIYQTNNYWNSTGGHKIKDYYNFYGADSSEFIENSYNMGTNVSRHHEKGLSGRRTQSSDNIKADPTLNHNNNNINATINNVTTKLPPENYVSKKDRNKFCGSLPNHLDADDVCENMFQPSVVGENTTINSDIESVEYISVTPKIAQHHQHLPPPPTYQQSSPFYSSSSGKGSTISANNLGSTFKSNSENKPDIQLKLPLLRTNIDAGCDQGYGSEKSPEEELPPPLHLVHDGQYKEILSSSHMPPHSVIQPNDMQQYWNYEKSNICGDYNFITKESIFFVQITKGPRGLGLSVSGGTDSNAAFPGLIRIKRLFPHQAAWATGMLQPGDILLAANGISLSGLTNYEALEVLRTVPNFVTLTVCRPLDEQYRKLSPPSEPPKPPIRTSVQQQYLYHPLPYLQPLDPLQTNFSGEFELILTKQQGSLGFTLRKEDDSILGHFVRALVREPATTDGRIKPGDRIMAVNDVPISNFTHEQAVIFLRQAADVVKLRLYRDIASTPISAHSPVDYEHKGLVCSENSFNKPKANLRPEAINLLTDIAYRKQTPNGNDSTNSSVKSNSTSPRRLRRAHNKSSDNQSYSNYSEGSTATYSDSDTSTIISQGNSYQMQQPSSSSSSCCNNHNPYPMNVLCDNDNPEAYYCDNELLELCGEDGCSLNGDFQNRPNYLNLAGESGHTPMSSRKPRFPFTVAKANAYELNNLDNETLDAPTMYTLNNQLAAPEPNDFTSLPCETYLVACKTESDLQEDSCDAIYVKHFNHKSPLYSSVNVQLKDKNTVSDVVDAVQKEGTKSLMKWKGVTLSPEHVPDEDRTVTPAEESSCLATMGTSTTTDTIRDLDSYDCGTDSEGNEIFTIELNRGWNSRLGFSLKQDQDTKKTYVSAIYSDSVAARDGRLKVGDQVLMVNDETMESLTTNEIIDLLRIVRGSICITLMRKLPKNNEENGNENCEETNEN